MIYLVGGPPRVGKSTLAAIATTEAGIPCCATDMIVGMLESAAPGLGVHHGFHRHKASSMANLLTHFAICADQEFDAYLIQGDVVTPSFVASVSPKLSEVRSVFMGNTKLTLEALRAAPDWLETADPAEYEHVRREVVRRSEELSRECAQAGYTYIDVGHDWQAGLMAAVAALGLEVAAR